MDFKLSEIDFGSIDFYYTSFRERKGIYLNKYLICVYPFAIKIHLLDEITITSIHNSWVYSEEIFYAHHTHFIDGKVDKDPCDVYEELKNSLDEYSFEDPPKHDETEEYDNAKDRLVANIKGILRETQINNILNEI